MQLDDAFRPRRDCVLWLHQFRQCGDRQKLRGYPLRSLACSDREFRSLADLLRGRVPRTRAQWMCFALFAVEWLRRRFDGGHWAYEQLFADLELPRDTVLDYDAFEEALELGWGVEVLHDRSGRDFFGTLLLHAMPPAALRGLRGALGEHLPRLIEARTEGASFERLVELARAHAHSLPSSWRSQTALVLLAGYADEIYLEAAGWEFCRTTPAHSCMNGEAQRLVAHARRLLDVGVDPIRMRRSIVTESSGFVWARELLVPASVGATALSRMFGVRDLELAPRIELLLESGGGERVRLATGRLGDAVGRPEYLLAPDSITLDDEPRQLLLSSGADLLGPIVLSGSERRGPLPWVFRPRSGDASRWDHVGEGNVRSCSTRLLIAPPPGVRPRGATPCGELEGRELFECEDRMTLQIGSFRCDVVANAPEDQLSEWRLEGEHLAGPVVGAPVFRGAPILVEVDGRGQRKRVAGRELQWRHGSNQPWSFGVAEARGHVELQYVQDDRIHWFGRARIVPADFEAELDPCHGHACELEMRGLERGMSAELSLPSGELIPSQAKGRWRLATLEDRGVRIRACLSWASGAKLRLRFRLPASTLGFERTDGSPLPDGAVVGLADLHRVAAVAAGAGHAAARLVIAAPPTDDSRRGVFETVMRLLARGRRCSCLDLLRLRTHLRVALAASVRADAAVKLVLDDGHEQRTLWVRRWARRVEVEDGVVRLGDDEVFGGASPATMEVLSFTDPSRRVSLFQSERGFEMPAEAERTMLLVARDHGRVCACPRPINVIAVSDEDAALVPAEREAHGLASVLAIRDKPTRVEALDRAIACLAADIEHPDWSIVDRYLDTLGDVHPSVFDIFERGIHQPEFVVLLLLRTRLSGVDRVWTALEELPFAWELVPISAWVAAARVLVDAHRDRSELLEVIGPHFEQLATLAARRSRSASLAFMCIRADLFKAPECANQLELVAGPLRAQLHAEREAARQQLIRSVEAQIAANPRVQWPMAPAISRLDEWVEQDLREFADLVPHAPRGCGFRQPLLAAPALAALLVLVADRFAAAVGDRHALIPRTQLLTELRLLQSAHPEWYRECFSLTLNLAAARCRRQLLGVD